LFISESNNIIIPKDIKKFYIVQKKFQADRPIYSEKEKQNYKGILNRYEENEFKKLDFEKIDFEKLKKD
jgi:hypothetical protein